MEPIVVMGGIIMVAGGIWSIIDLLEDAGIQIKRHDQDHAYSDFNSRVINSRTASRAGLPQWRIS